MQCFCHRPSRVYIGVRDGFVDHNSRSTYWFKVKFLAFKHNLFTSYEEIINIHIPIHLEIPANICEISKLTSNCHILFRDNKLVANSLLSFRIIKPTGKFYREKGSSPDFHQFFDIKLSDIVWKNGEEPKCLNHNLKAPAEVEIQIDPRPYIH